MLFVLQILLYDIFFMPNKVTIKYKIFLKIQRKLYKILYIFSQNTQQASTVTYQYYVKDQ